MSETAPTLFENRPAWEGEFTVKPISSETAALWIPRYHYSGTVGNGAGTFYGVYADDLWLVVAIGQTSNVHGLAAKLGLGRWPGNWEITRVARHPESEFPVSAGVARVLAQLHSDAGLDWVFSYADSGQNHHGGIYQALNAVYVGKNLGGKPPPEWEIFRDGEWQRIHARSVGAICGTRAGAPQRMAELGFQIRSLGESSDKHTYVLPIGTARTRFEIRAALRVHAKPYPKRTPAAGVGETISAHQPGSVGAMPTRRSELEKAA